MKRIILWIVLLVVVGGAGWIAFKWYQAQGSVISSFSLIPADAIYWISTDDPIETWKIVARSTTWEHLEGNAYFSTLTSSMNSLDSMIRDNDVLFNMIGSRSLIISAHMTGNKKYDFLFTVDLKKASGIKFLQDYISGFGAEGYTIRKEKYGEDDVLVVSKRSDTSKLYMSLPGSNLIASYTRKIVIASLEASHEAAQAPADNPGGFQSVADELGTNGILRMYLNYELLPQFVTCYSDGPSEYVNRLAQVIKSTGLSLDLDGDLLKAEGTTHINDSIESYLKTLETSGSGPRDITDITPQRTAFYLGFGFKSFPEFFANLEKNLQQDVAQYNEYKANLRQVEDYLKISIQKNFVDWIGDEVAIFELQSSGTGEDTEAALVLKADNIEKAKVQLAYVEKMVKRRTPVKFKTIDHNGYKISYLSMKGLFKVLLGKFFARYDKPYYTIINNYVIFSSHPQALESIIDDYLDKNTLGKSEDFRSFEKQFEDEGSAFVYVNTPILFNTMTKLADRPTRASMEKNRDYIVCFRQLGFQLVPSPGEFKTRFIEKFERPFVVVETEEADSTMADTAAEVVAAKPKAAKDPMALPYIYAKNLNAKLYTLYFPDSSVRAKVELKNGFKDGDYTEYYLNGKVKMKGKFRRDARDGKWHLYDEAGMEIMSRTYEDGRVEKEKLYRTD